MTAALLSQWTVQRLNSHSNPSSTGESSTAKKDLMQQIVLKVTRLEGNGVYQARIIASKILEFNHYDDFKSLVLPFTYGA